MSTPRRPAFVIGLITTVACVIALPSLDAATVTVSPAGPIPTIQAGILAAGPGGTVIVKPGVYRENLKIPGGMSGLKLKAAGSVTIEARGAGGVGLGSGIVVDAESVAITGFLIQNAKASASGAPGHGIQVTKPGVSIKKCTIRSCRDNGIDITNGDGTTIAKCDVAGCNGGIIAAGSNTTVTGVQVSKCDFLGIDVSGSHAAITKCTVRVIGGDGIRIDGDEGLIEKCVVANVEESLIALNGSKGVIRKCVASTSYGTGIDADGDECTVEHNVVRACGEGISSDGSANRIAGNTIEDIPDRDGIFASGDAITIENNSIESIYHGIHMTSAPTSGSIAHNAVRRTLDHGIVVAPGCNGFVVEANVVLDAGADAHSHAFDIHGSKHQIRANIARRAAGDGFNVNGPDITVDANTALENGEDGIDVEGGSNVFVTHDVAKRNAAEGIENNANGTLIAHNVATQNRIDFANNSAAAVFDANVGGDGTQGGNVFPEIDN